MKQSKKEAKKNESQGFKIVKKKKLKEKYSRGK